MSERPVFEADYSEDEPVDDESRRISRRIYALSVATDNKNIVNNSDEFFELAQRVEDYLEAKESKPLTG